MPALLRRIERAKEQRAEVIPMQAQGSTSSLFTDGWQYDLSGLGAQPHLIRDVLEMQSTAWMVGPSGSYKSFIALSMAVAVATGHHWQGRETCAGPVVYICSEGSKAWGKRMAAQIQMDPTLKEDRRPFHMIPAPVQIGSPEWTGLVAALEQIKPALVVVDTQAQCSNEYEENSNSDMAKVCAHLAKVAQMTGSAVLTVHHSGHMKEGSQIRARGASAIYAAADTELTVLPKTDKADDIELRYVEVTASKQKDLRGGHLIHLAPHVVEIEGTSDYYGRPVTSIVMMPYEPVEPDEKPSPETWARRLYAAGVREPMGRDRLADQAVTLGLSGFPGKITERAEITKRHKALCAEGG
ncbi:AAA family ATPase [Streptomyces sp. NPDC000927]|uniref:AAA family ATPase n=1 Tax=Streptomyces sp. NPDC000927 TaxID=3154371 RepID=UPI00331DE9B3